MHLPLNTAPYVRKNDISSVFQSNLNDHWWRLGSKVGGTGQCQKCPSKFRILGM